MDRDKPVLIGITCKSGKENFYLPKPYVRAILKSGGLPLLLPEFKDGKHMRSLIDLLDGLLLAGGGDIDPKFYGESPKGKLKRVHPERDDYELELLRRFKETGKPILGICRGIQVINVAFGGDLYQNIEGMTEITHWQKGPVNSPSHEIIVKKNTLLHKILGVEHLMVNSFHHQAIRNLASGFLASAYAPDNIIETIEYPGHNFFLGVQFHPEYMRLQETFKKIFDKFVGISRCYRD